MRLLRAAALLLVLSVGAGAEDVPSRGGPIRLALRRGSFEDPGVVQVRGARAFDVRRMWFGENESPAVSPGEVQGMTVAVPPGAPRSRVRVRAEMADGRIAAVGTFRYDDPLFPGGTREIEAGGVLGCLVGDPPDVRSLDVRTLSGVRRLRDGTFSYRYLTGNPFTGTVTFHWDVMERLGFPGGLMATLGPGEAFETERIDASRPVFVEGTAGVDGRPGCGPGNEGEAAWYSTAWLPAAALPPIGPLRNVRVIPAGDGASIVAWEDPESGPPERVAITVRYVKASGYVPRGEHRFREYVTAPGATSAGIGYVSEGVVSVFLQPVRDGFKGEGVLAYAVH
jgi:hypothetical protein